MSGMFKRMSAMIALAGMFSAPIFPSIKQAPDLYLGRKRRRKSLGRYRFRGKRDNLPRGYPGAKLARKAMLGQLTLRR